MWITNIKNKFKFGCNAEVKRVIFTNQPSLWDSILFDWERVAFIIVSLTILAFMVEPRAHAKEESLASVGPDRTLLELGCSIAKALKDPSAEDRCGKLSKKTSTAEDEEVFEREIKSQSTARAKAMPAS